MVFPGSSLFQSTYLCLLPTWNLVWSKKQGRDPLCYLLAIQLYSNQLFQSIFSSLVCYIIFICTKLTGTLGTLVYETVTFLVKVLGEYWQFHISAYTWVYSVISYFEA